MTDSALAPRRVRHTPVEVVQPAPIDRGTRAITTRDHAVALVFVGIASIYWIGSLLAIILGHLALARIHDWNGWIGGKGVVTTVIVLGYIGLGVLALLMLRGIVLAVTGRRGVA